MFSQVFVFILKCISQYINLLTNIYIDPGLSLFTFLFCLNAIVILLALFRHIKSDIAEEQAWLRNKERNEEYNSYHSWLRKNAGGDNK